MPVFQIEDLFSSFREKCTGKIPVGKANLKINPKEATRITYNIQHIENINCIY